MNPKSHTYLLYFESTKSKNLMKLSCFLNGPNRGGKEELVRAQFRDYQKTHTKNRDQIVHRSAQTYNFASHNQKSSICSSIGLEMATIPHWFFM